MSNVTLYIGGRTFTVSCTDGEEEHVTALGALVDKKVETLGPNAGQNEVRMLLYATLILADELKEARAKLAQHAAAPPPAPAIPAGLAEKLDQIAIRIENIAGHLENEASDA